MRYVTVYHEKYLDPSVDGFIEQALTDSRIPMARC